MKSVFCAALSALLLAGCATVTRGTNDVFVVNTDPSGAAVRTTNQFACDATPCSFKMARKSEFEVTITKPGYKPWTGHIAHKIGMGGSAGFVGNAVIGGLIGATVDLSTGAVMDLTPNPLIVKLEADVQPAVLASLPTPASALAPTMMSAKEPTNSAPSAEPTPAIGVEAAADPAPPPAPPPPAEARHHGCPMRSLTNPSDVSC